MAKSKDKMEDFFKGIGHGLVLYFIILGFGMLFKFSFKEIAFTLICCGVSGIYLLWFSRQEKK